MAIQIDVWEFDNVLRKGDFMSKAIDDILVERARQKNAEGYSDSHDDEHDDGSLAFAGAAYALANTGRSEHFWRIQMDARQGRIEPSQHIVPMCWPHSWAGWHFKPKDRRFNLIRAAALIVAEIERIDRAAMRQDKNDSTQ